MKTEAGRPRRGEAAGADPPSHALHGQHVDAGLGRLGQVDGQLRAVGRAGTGRHGGRAGGLHQRVLEPVNVAEQQLVSQVHGDLRLFLQREGREHGAE